MEDIVLLEAELEESNWAVAAEVVELEAPRVSPGLMAAVVEMLSSPSQKSPTEKSRI